MISRSVAKYHAPDRLIDMGNALYDGATSARSVKTVSCGENRISTRFRSIVSGRGTAASDERQTRKDRDSRGNPSEAAQY
jgi:hypothetical protein